MKFDVSAKNALVIMYPTGGFGNFLHLILDRHINCTVKAQTQDFQFSSSGDSHAVPRHVESFLLGQQTGNFSYGYAVSNHKIDSQIKQGRVFCVLADVGNKGDNVNFLRRYFPNAFVVRVYAATFEEKLVVWYNCVTKSMPQHLVYKDSLLTIQGIKMWAGRESITDQHAVDCMTKFFIDDFYPFGRFFNRPTDDVLNIPVRDFFTVNAIVATVKSIANSINSYVIMEDKLRVLAQDFIDRQPAFGLLDHRIDQFPLISRALHAYRIRLATSQL